jgi:hypothetical protein
MDENEFSEINPSHVRALITINEPAKLLTDNIELVLKYEYISNSPETFEFTLKLNEQTTIAAKSNWLTSTPVRHQYELELSPKSINEFRHYQRQFLLSGKPKKFRWDVYYYLEKDLPKGFSIDLDLALKFSKSGKYITIFEGASIDID